MWPATRIPKSRNIFLPLSRSRPAALPCRSPRYPESGTEKFRELVIQRFIAVCIVVVTWDLLDMMPCPNF
jgi:hypothetical protein